MLGQAPWRGGGVHLQLVLAGRRPARRGFALHLVNTAAVKQEGGLKYSGDFSDARHLAHLLRLGILPTGYIYPREERAVRDLLRKRGQLVRQRSTQILSMSRLLARNLGSHASGNAIKHWTSEVIDAIALLDEQKLAMKANLAVMRCLDVQVKALEHSILAINAADIASSDEP